MQSGHLVMAVPVPSLVDVFEGFVDFPKFRGQQGKVPAGIGGNLFAAMDAGVFFDVRGDVFRDRVVVSEKGAEDFFHGGRFLAFWGRYGLGPGSCSTDFSNKLCLKSVRL